MAVRVRHNDASFVVTDLLKKILPPPDLLLVLDGIGYGENKVVDLAASHRIL
jgi:hypothetical protein